MRTFPRQCLPELVLARVALARFVACAQGTMCAWDALAHSRCCARPQWELCVRTKGERYACPLGAAHACPPRGASRALKGAALVVCVCGASSVCTFKEMHVRNFLCAHTELPLRACTRGTSSVHGASSVPMEALRMPPKATHFKHLCFMRSISCVGLVVTIRRSFPQLIFDYKEIRGMVMFPMSIKRLLFQKRSLGRLRREKRRGVPRVQKKLFSLNKK